MGWVERSRGNCGGGCSVTQSCLTLCYPVDGNAPGFPVFYHRPEYTQTHVCLIGDAILPSHPLSSPFVSCPQSSPAPESFPVSQLFTSGGQRTGPSASASILPMNIQGWFPLELTGLVSLLPKGHSEVFSSTTVRKHQFYSTQPSLCSKSHIHTRLLAKP